jgi:hypothetical protein
MARCSELSICPNYDSPQDASDRGSFVRFAVEANAEERSSLDAAARSGSKVLDWRFGTDRLIYVVGVLVSGG